MVWHQEVCLFNEFFVHLTKLERKFITIYENIRERIVLIEQRQREERSAKLRNKIRTS